MFPYATNNQLRTGTDKGEAAAGKFKGKTCLVLGTGIDRLECANGKKFATGHNPTETFMPLAHLAHAGFAFDFATPAGTPFPIEAWAWNSIKACGVEEPLRKVEAETKEGMANPMTIADGLAKMLEGKYSCFFWPGGHGSLNCKREASAEDFGKILTYCHTNSITTISLCHGPDAFRCAPEGTYKGYRICSFLDKADDLGSKFGYLPGKLKDEDYPQKNLLKEQGMIYMNKGPKQDADVFVDREVVTGSTNQAAQNLGEAAVLKLMEVLLGGEASEAKAEVADEQPRKGACKCGAVEYEVQDVMVAAYCHCKDCQTFFGAPFAKLTAVQEEDFKLTKGADSLEEMPNGDKGSRYVCKSCSGFVYNLYSIGVVAVESDLEPTRHIHYSERAADVDDSLHKDEGEPTFSVTSGFAYFD
jgi:molecular chaperone Hsp31 and glyoxalase 3